MSLDLLKERFGHSISTNKKEVDNKEKINEKLIDKFNSNDMENLKSFNPSILLELNISFSFFLSTSFLFVDIE